MTWKIFTHTHIFLGTLVTGFQKPEDPVWMPRLAMGVDLRINGKHIIQDCTFDQTLLIEVN